MKSPIWNQNLRMTTNQDFWKISRSANVTYRRIHNKYKEIQKRKLQKLIQTPKPKKAKMQSQRNLKNVINISKRPLTNTGHRTQDKHRTQDTQDIIKRSQLRHSTQVSIKTRLRDSCRSRRTEGNFRNFLAKIIFHL